jgi:flagellar operon protein
MEVINKIGGISARSNTLPTGSASGKQRFDGEQQGAEALTFSKHLSDRMNRRKIDFSADTMSRLTQAVDRVAGKGARDSVVLLDNLAVLVNIPNRTVLTAIETGKMKDGIFTNIDSVVVG